MFILWLFHFAFDKVLLKNFTTTTTTKFEMIGYLMPNFSLIGVLGNPCRRENAAKFDSECVVYSFIPNFTLSDAEKNLNVLA